MVSKARLLLPLPDSPVITIRRSRGISTSRFLRLCSRAPRTTIRSEGIGSMISDRCERLFCSALPAPSADESAVVADDERVAAAIDPVWNAVGRRRIVEMADED